MFLSLSFTKATHPFQGLGGIEMLFCDGLRFLNRLENEKKSLWKKHNNLTLPFISLRNFIKQLVP